MKLVFTSPYQHEADLIDHGVHLTRGATFTVPDALGEELLKHPLLYAKPETPKPPEREQTHETHANKPPDTEHVQAKE